MCLAIPAKVLEKEGERARVEFGQGTIREINISLVDVEVGDWVIVHAGFAIQTLDEEEAEKTIDLWEEMLARDEGIHGVE
jgi:hydrogenase expression/formation protein HypC